MNEYERMRDVTHPFSCVALEEWRDMQIVDYENFECVREQLFAEYLMEAGMLPYKYDVEEITEEADGCFVTAWYLTHFYCFSQFWVQEPKPRYWQ